MQPGDYDEDRGIFALPLSRQEYRRLAEIAAYCSFNARLIGQDPPRLTVEFVLRCYLREGLSKARVPVGPSEYTGASAERDEEQGAGQQ